MTEAGIAESCGQWWLVGRNVEYGWDGKHDLCITDGGREGQAGGKRILFDEREWSFDVCSLSESASVTSRERAKDQAKRAKEERKLNQVRQRIISACRNEKKPQSRTRIRDASGQSGVILRAGRHQTFRRTDILVRPCGTPRGATDEDVRRTSPSGPREVELRSCVLRTGSGTNALAAHELTRQRTVVVYSGAVGQWGSRGR